ncbi:MAG: hypothetical protein KGS60_14850 [Verrucomicrobia bacterium]|nr:hypothetical protein [Verrucomicrobiota bacterium]
MNPGPAAFAIPLTLWLSVLLPAATGRGQTLPAPLLNAPLPGARPASAPPPPPHAAPASAPRPFTLADFKAQVPVSPEGHFLLTVPQICHTTGDPQVREILAGRTVRTLAQVPPAPAADSRPPRLRVSRQLLHCCASHARTYSLALDFGTLTPPANPGPWAHITGRIRYQREGLELVPVLEVSAFEEAAAPPQPILN